MDNRRVNYNSRTDRSPVRHTSPARRSKDSKVNSVKEWLKTPQNMPDYLFLAVVILLLAFGLLMLFSAGSSRALASEGDSLFFVKRQLRAMILGGLGMFVASRIDYHKLGGRKPGLLYIGCGVLLIMVLIGFGRTAGGATRWIKGFGSFQPSEIAKIAIIVLFSYNLSQPSVQKELKSFKNGFLPYLIMLGVYDFLIILQPHFSCVVLMSLTAMLILYVAGAPFKFFVAIGVLGIVGACGLIVAEPYRMARVVSFLDPFADAQGSGWQIVQSLYAIGSGGIFGVGLGKSRQKFLSLPEPHNDFIFSVLCEELGLIGAIILIGLFILLVIRGIKIAAKAPDLFGTLLVTGIVGIVALQALINIAVVTASMPVTGMPLPFFSYGGTALAITMTEMGIVLNVSRQAKH